MRHLLEQIRMICSTHPIAEKWVFVPSLQVGSNTWTSLSANGIATANLRFVTPLGFAQQQVPLVAANMISRDQGLVIVADILTDDQSLARRFAGDVRITPGVISAVYSALRATRLSGVDPFTRGRLADLNAKYEVKLAGRADERVAYLTALDAVVDRPPQNLAWILADTRLSPLESIFLRAACPEMSLVGSDVAIGEAPAWTAAGQFSSREENMRDASAFEIQDLVDGNLHVVDADDERTEISGIVREVITRKIPMGDVEIVYSSRGTYLPLLLAQASTVPISFSEGYPSRLTVPGRLLQAYLRWLESGWKKRLLVELLQSRGLSLVPDRPAYRLAEYVLDKRLPSGMENLRNHLLELGAARPTGGDQPDLFSHASDAGVILSLLENVKPSSNWQSFVRGLMRFLKTNCQTFTTRDKEAKQAIMDRLGNLSSSERSGTVGDFARFVSDLLLHNRVSAAVARPDAMYAVPIERAGFSGRGFTFFVGLDDETFPGSTGASPADGADSEAKWNETTPADARWFFTRSLNRTHGDAYLISRRFDALEGGQIEPTPLVALARQQPGVSSHTRHVQPDPQVAISATAFILAEARAANADQLCRHAFPETHAAMNVDRAKLAMDEYSGVVPGVSVGIKDAGEKVSASDLETLVKCPYRYFIRRMLRITRPDDDGDEEYKWLDNRQRGSFLHELYQRFAEALQKKGERPDYQRHAAMIDALFEEMVETHLLQIPVKSRASFAYEKEMLRRSAHIFLRSWAEEPELTPVEFELGFGSDQDVFVELDADFVLNLRGKIDRIDEDEEGYIVWDYKTGGDWFKPGNLLDGGANLQWFIYGFAYDAMSDNKKKKVTRGGYWMASSRGRGRRHLAPVPERAQVAQTLRPVADLAHAGVFPHMSRDAKACDWCDYNNICARELITDKTVGEVQSSDDAVLELMNAWIKGVK